MMRRHCPAFRALTILAVTAGWCSSVLAQAAPPTNRVPPTGAAVATEAIAEASARFGIPEAWIRAIIRAESFGDARAVSPKGAIGLMQVMPATFATLRAQLRLGADPFDVHDNIIAGAAYMRLMFDRFGLVGMVAAYNAGPDRWQAYLAGARPLPVETLAYLARLAPVLGFAAPVAMSKAASPLVQSPSEAPLFVALRGDPGAEQRTAERQRALTVLADQPTVVPQSGSASEGIQVTPAAPSPSSKSATRGVAEPLVPSAAATAPPTADTLLVASTPRRLQ